MPLEVLIPIVGAIATIIGGVILKIAEKFLARSADRVTEDDAISTGLRADIARKETEIGNLKTELRDVENDLDSYKEESWILYDLLMELRVTVKIALKEVGWSDEQIDEVIPQVSRMKHNNRDTR